VSAAVERILALYRDRGARAYLGEPVSLAEHALQTAAIAERSGAPGQLVAAALVHDVGHLLRASSQNCAGAGVDDRHEELGSAFLARYFPQAVSEPVRLHVAAKRYLCATDPEYFKRLSAASVVSLGLQGGPMSPPSRPKPTRATPCCCAAGTKPPRSLVVGRRTSSTFALSWKGSSDPDGRKRHTRPPYFHPDRIPVRTA
jgi:predicted HD phosphohydrolase